MAGAAEGAMGLLGGFLEGLAGAAGMAGVAAARACLRRSLKRRRARLRRVRTSALTDSGSRADSAIGGNQRRPVRPARACLSSRLAALIALSCLARSASITTGPPI
jgi:hypothetical protein